MNIRLQDAIVENSCRGLLQRYLCAIDARRWEVLTAVFSAEASWQRQGGPILRGPQQIMDFFHALEAARSARSEIHITRHHLTTVRVDAAGPSRARALSYVIVVRKVLRDGVLHPSPGAPRPELLLEYDDVIARDPSGWRIYQHAARQIFRSNGAPAPR